MIQQELQIREEKKDEKTRVTLVGLISICLPLAVRSLQNKMERRQKKRRKKRKSSPANLWQEVRKKKKKYGVSEIKDGNDEDDKSAGSHRQRRRQLQFLFYTNDFLVQTFPWQNSSCRCQKVGGTSGIYALIVV